MALTRYLNRKEAAEYLTRKGLKTSPKSLGKWASTGGGPPYRLWGRVAVSTELELDDYAEEKLSPPRRHTSEVA